MPTRRVLQDKLSVYIEKFVLCPRANYGTSYKIKHEIIYHNCLAWRARAVHMQHKLTTYILKQHKIEKAKAKDKKAKGDKKRRRSGPSVPSRGLHDAVDAMRALTASTRRTSPRRLDASRESHVASTPSL